MGDEKESELSGLFIIKVIFLVEESANAFDQRKTNQKFLNESNLVI